ncbi:MAG: hypothetical protein KGJ64_10640 [Betaproteobacteria bacterium]|nr:hypothetical protein [Betaproteobacteria bacterium]
MTSSAAADLHFRHVPASRGVAWWGEGWRNFLRAPWVWLGLSLLLLLLTMLLHMFPLGGVLVQWLNLPLFALGAVFASVLQRRWRYQSGITPPGQTTEADNEGAFGESSRRWGSRLGPLMLASLLVLLLITAAVVLLMVVLGVVFGVGLLDPQAIEHMFQGSPGEMMAGMGMRIGMMLGLALLVLLLLFVASALFWFVGTLVALGGLGPWHAVRLSARAGLRNLGALVVFSLLLVPFGILAMIPMGLGLLVLLPVLSGASYASFDDVFGAAPGTAAEPG